MYGMLEFLKTRYCQNKNFATHINKRFYEHNNIFSFSYIKFLNYLLFFYLIKKDKTSLSNNSQVVSTINSKYYLTNTLLNVVKDALKPSHYIIRLPPHYKSSLLILQTQPQTVMQNFDELFSKGMLFLQSSEPYVALYMFLGWLRLSTC